MDRLYYTYLIIKESLDYIPAIEIKGQLEEKYQIKVDVKTVYQAIRNINELSKYVYQKEIIKTKHRKGYSIDEEFFNDGQFQYLWDSVLFNNDLNEDEVNALKIPLIFDEDFGLELDEEKLADAIMRLIDDEALRLKLSANAIKNYQERFTLTKMIDNTINVYEQLIEQDNA